MNISNSDKVNDFLTDLQSVSPDQFDILLSIRELFLDSNKDLVEDIKYGGLVFNHSGSLVGGVYAYKKHLSIEFSNGADFVDDDAVLEGSGKRRRHLKIASADDIQQKNSAYFIKQAV